MTRRGLALGLVGSIGSLAGFSALRRRAEGTAKFTKPAEAAEIAPERWGYRSRWKPNPEYLDAPLAEVVFNDRLTLVLNREGDWNALGAKFTGRRYIPHGIDSLTGEIIIVEVAPFVKK